MDDSSREGQPQPRLEGASVDMSSGRVRLRAPGPELALAEATGSVGNSCHRCLLALGFMGLLVGAAATGVGYGQDEHGSVLAVLGLVLLGAGVLALCGSWAAARLSRRQKLSRKESVTVLVGEGWAE